MAGDWSVLMRNAFKGWAALLGGLAPLFWQALLIDLRALGFLITYLPRLAVVLLFNRRLRKAWRRLDEARRSATSEGPIAHQAFVAECIAVLRENRLVRF